jgi:hypothetical protein
LENKKKPQTYQHRWLRHRSSGKSLASHRGGPGSNPGLVMWDFVVDKLALGQVFSEYISVSPANPYSTNFSTITITYHPGLVQ